MFINVKKFKKSNFKDHRGYYWTSWKKNSIKKKIDPSITYKIWKCMIWSYISFERKNFKKR